MKTCKRWLALLLCVLMLTSAFPVSAVEVTAEPAAQPSTEVIYNLLDMEVTVGSDPSRATGDEPYVLFEADGSYTIELDEPNPVFPYEVQFTCNGETDTHWFVTTDDCVTVGGHCFYIHTDTTPTEIGLYVGEDYVPAYPEEKTFTNGAAAEPASLLPLKEEQFNLDLSMYLIEELRSVSARAILPESAELSGDEEIVWSIYIGADWGGFKTDIMNNDHYQIQPLDTTFDLYEMFAEYNYLGYKEKLKLIVGTADQLNTNNARYVISIEPASIQESWLKISAKMAEEPQEELEVLSWREYQSKWSNPDTAETWTEMMMNVTLGAPFRNGTFRNADNGDLEWISGTSVYVTMNFAEGRDITDLTVRVYEGCYDTLEKLQQANPEEITEQIWGEDASGFLWDEENLGVYEMTFVCMRGEKLVWIAPRHIDLYGDSTQISTYGMFMYDKDTGEKHWATSTSSVYGAWEHETWTEMMDSGYPADAEYFLVASAYKYGLSGGTTWGIELIDAAYVGTFESKREAEAAGAVDIKEQLFSSNGYPANYSKGVTFSIIPVDQDINYSVIYYTVKTEDAAEEPSLPTLPSEPSPLSADTYFRASGAMTKTQTGEKQQLNSYVMPYEHDSYYNNGYQTVFLLTPENEPIADGTVIYPTFTAGSQVNVFASADHASAAKQKSGETPLTFISGKAIQYSAAAENGTHLKNYWVTFLSRQTGASLFVNGATNSEHLDEQTGLPVREILLDEAHEYVHDVFFANIGDTELTGLYVRLEDAQNIQLDAYWTIGETTTLAPFTDTVGYEYGDEENASEYGELRNVGKIRLVQTEAETETLSEISGTLVIGSENGGEVKIKLTGLSGNLKMTTDSIVDGVKYVPYSSVIQTNNMHGDSTVRFELTDGALPDGLILKPNGEIYGTPQESGTFYFAVKATHSEYEAASDATLYAITIQENSDDNVWNATDSGYEVIDAVGTLNAATGEWVLQSYTDELFWTEGSYGYFVDFWLDGQKLVRGVDYEADEGSTKITIFEQTLRKAGRGKHTIAAEFREGDSEDGALKRAAQNYTLNLSSGGGSGSIVTTKPVNQAPTTEKKPTQDKSKQHAVFTDVLRTNWFYGDVDWAYTQGLMFGVGNNRFAPQNKINLAMVVTTLARMSKVDLSVYENYAYLKKYTDIQANRWYTEAAIWAKEQGLLSDKPFAAEDPLPRDELAVILVKYLSGLGVDVSVPSNPATFADANEMTAETLQAFQILNRFGIFNGIGNNKMNPRGQTTRAELAALLHRLSVFIENVKAQQ